MKKIGVIGSGTMGTGIAHVSALSGFNTVLLDINDGLLELGLKIIESNLNRQLKKEKITQLDMNETLEKIELTTNYDDLFDCDVIIEAATENRSIKEKIFKSMDDICKIEAILATNTSSISITEMANVTKRPEKVIGMHFMNPVSIMKLVEIIRGKLTSDETTEKVKNLVEVLNKTPVECNDSSGFVSNRILMPMINEAVFCLADGVATAEAIDKIMTVGMAHPMGPLTLADLIGLDICLAIMEVLHRDMGDNKYRPCPLLEEMVSAGNLGRKTGQGFYSY